MSIESIKARVEKATEGPWHYAYDPGNNDRFGWLASTGVTYQTEGEWKAVCKLEEPNKQDCKNMGFIAHSRTDIPLLLAAAELLGSMPVMHQDQYRKDEYGRWVWTPEMQEWSDKRFAALAALESAQ